MWHSHTPCGRMAREDPCDPVKVPLKPQQRSQNIGDGRMLSTWLGKFQAAGDTSSREVAWSPLGLTALWMWGVFGLLAFSLLPSTLTPRAPLISFGSFCPL